MSFRENGQFHEACTMACAWGYVRMIVASSSTRGYTSGLVRCVTALTASDLATWLMDGRRPDAAAAVTQRIKPDVYPRVGDEATSILKYPHAQAIVQASWNWPFSRKDMEVYGQKGYVITVGRDQVRVRLPEREETSASAKALEKTKEDSVSYLRAVLLGGLKPEGQSSLETNVIVTEILDAARQSAATGKTVPLAGKR